MIKIISLIGNDVQLRCTLHSWFVSYTISAFPRVRVLAMFKTRGNHISFV